MNTKQNPPSVIDSLPDLQGGIAGMLRFVLRKFALDDLDHCLPAAVTATDGRNFASVQPLVQMVTTQNERVSRAIIERVPILQLGAGGYVLSFPVQAGDLGWLVACDRDITGVLQTRSEQPPADRTFHDFRNGVFIPDAARKWAIHAPQGAVTLESADGSAMIYLSAEKACIRHPALVEIDAPAVGMSGNLTVAGTIQGDVVRQGGVVLGTHVHGGVVPGGGTSGGPQ